MKRLTSTLAAVVLLGAVAVATAGPADPSTASNGGQKPAVRTGDAEAPQKVERSARRRARDRSSSAPRRAPASTSQDPLAKLRTVTGAFQVIENAGMTAGFGGTRASELRCALRLRPPLRRNRCVAPAAAVPGPSYHSEQFAATAVFRLSTSAPTSSTTSTSSTSSTSTSTTTLPPPVCGNPDGGAAVDAADALLILRSAVGQPITCEPCVCDVDNDGKVVASDALLVLRFSVGEQVTLNCPACP